MDRYLLAFLMLCATSAYAETHRWIDDHGKVHYSDQPPVGVDATALRAAPGPASAPAAVKTYTEREADLKKSQQKKKEAEDLAAQKQAEAAQQRSRCDAARQALIPLQAGARMSEFDANGEQRYLNDSERQQRIAEAQDAVNKSCK